MLVLQRNPGESVLIYIDGLEPIEVKLIDSRKGFSNLGFTAPRHVRILRRELVDRDASAAALPAPAG